MRVVLLVRGELRLGFVLISLHVMLSGEREQSSKSDTEQPNTPQSHVSDYNERCWSTGYYCYGRAGTGDEEWVGAVKSVAVTISIGRARSYLSVKLDRLLLVRLLLISPMTALFLSAYAGATSLNFALVLPNTR